MLLETISSRRLARTLLTACLPLLIALHAMSAEYHVSIGGNDTSPGTAGAPLRSIQAAAQLAQPGDTITVHGGTYRERIDPPRGGSSDSRRITFQAAPGEKVVIKGSEPVKTWEKQEGPVWKAAFPNSFFGGRNPYRELIEGDWFLPEFGPVHTGEVYLNGRFFTEVQKQEDLVNPLARLKTMDRWFCTGDAETTTIFANFGDRDPIGELVEINVRETCFYPSKPGIDFITVRGFTMCQAATQWSAPTAEQVGLIGTNASKGWIIEGNTVSDSRCAGITLGKSRESGHNVWTANPKLDGTNLYNEMVDAEFAAGWAKSKTGSHIVRQNTIFNCEQAGICGSITPAFSLIEDNHIYNIHVRNQFAGWEQAAIKFHGAIDAVVRRNRIHHSNRGMWFDWMAQGTRVTGNLLYDNGDGIFVEVNHGPFVLDNNIIVGGVALRDMSEGGTYAHNLFAGPIVSQPVYDRVTPFMEAHSTKPLGRAVTQGGDNRFFNNIFVGDGSPRLAGERNPKEVLGGFGLWVYDNRPLPSFAGGNLYLHGAAPYKDESATVLPADPGIKVVEDGDAVFLELSLPEKPGAEKSAPVTAARLGLTAVTRLPYEDPDGSALAMGNDYFGRLRTTLVPGPFATLPDSPRLQVWPIK